MNYRVFLWVLLIELGLISSWLDAQSASEWSQSETNSLPGILLTTNQTISFFYPKEMNYENDFMHIVFKINKTSPHRIEDCVYDNKTWSIYLIFNSPNGSSSLIRLKQQRRFRSNQPILFSNSSPKLNFSYELASNWHISSIYSNSTSRMLSLDINVHRRKLYWFEFDEASQKWSIGVLKLLNPLAKNSINLYALENKFSTDGLSYLAVVSDSTAFVSNDQSLSICHLANGTCFDYFRDYFIFVGDPNSTSLNSYEGTKTCLKNKLIFKNSDY